MEKFITTPVITGDFKPKFYWTNNAFENAERINRPHIKAEGENENRIHDTIDILNDLSGVKEITLNDAFNIQNRLLKSNNWRGIKSGLREHTVEIKKGDGKMEQTPNPSEVSGLISQLFPVKPMDKTSLLEWYKQVQMIHPLSDLNGRVFGIIVALLHTEYAKTH